MAWRLSSWLVLVRLFQLLGAFASAAENGFLIYYLYDHRLGPTDYIVTLEMMICILFVYTSLVLLIQHTGKRSKRTAWLVCFIVFDCIFAGVVLCTISVLAYTGLPSNCYDLTRSNFNSKDAPNRPHPGYTTIRFSKDGKHGELDKYCGLERSFYFTSIALIYTYIITIVVSVLRICEGKYTRNSDVRQMMESQENVLHLEQKFNESRPVLVSSANSPAIAGAPFITSHTLEEGIVAAPNTVPPSPTGAGTTTTAGPHPRMSARPPSSAFGGPASSTTTTAYTEPGASSRRLSFASSSPTAVNPVSPVLSFASVGDASSTAVAAHMAMVADGSRYNNHYGIQLPPYSPGRGMSGHGEDESNEMRLSGYVKGEERAQDMKDSGRF